MVHSLYWVSTFAFAILLIAALVDNIRSKTNLKSRRAFIILLCWVIWFCIQDGVWGLCGNGILPGDGLFFASSTVFHLSTVLTTYFWQKYIITYLGGNVRHKKLSNIIIYIIIAMQCVLLIVNIFTPTVFAVRDGIYYTYPLRFLAFFDQYVVYLAIGLTSLFRAFSEKDGNRMPFVNVFLFSLGPILSGAFQYLYPDGPFYSMGYFFGCFIVYVFVVNAETSARNPRKKKRSAVKSSIREKTNRLIAASVIGVSFVLITISVIVVNMYSRSVSNTMMKDAIDAQVLRVNSDQRSIEQAAHSIYEMSKYVFNDYSNISVDEDTETYLNLFRNSAISIAQNSKGVAAVYFRLSPEIAGDGKQGFFYVRKNHSGEFERNETTDILAYDEYDDEHVGWYYNPIRAKRGMWLSPYYNANVGFNMISYVLPIFEGDTPLGVIGLDVDFDHMISIAEDVDVYKSAGANIIDAEKNEVYYSKCDLFGEKLNEDVYKRISESAGSLKMIPVTVDGESYNMHFATLNNGMKIMVYAKRSDMFEVGRTLIIYGIIIFAGIFLIALLIAVRFANRITDPIARLNSAAKEFAKGNWNVKLDIDTDDEFEELAENVRYMAQQTQNSISELNDALAVAKEANNAKSAFLANVSHDIRTPMNAIISFSQFAISQPEISEKTYSYLDNILQASRHLLSLINSVLEMSRIESGKTQINPVPCNIKELVEELGNLVYANVSEKNQILNIDASGITHEWIMCDSLRFNQIMINLVGNAVKFTGEGGTITVTAWEEASHNPNGAMYHFKVKDTGIGIEEKFIDKIFEPFERETSSGVNRIQGTGLGLSITKNFIELMGGKIGVQSKKGEGTEFIIDVMFDFKGEDKEEGGAESHNGSVDISALKVLLVEDNKVNRLIVRELLGSRVSVLDEAENGKVALEVIKSHDDDYYDLILMDVQMPEMNGYEATEAIRGMEGAVSKVPIIAMTANAFEEDKRNAMVAGMDAHVAKPIDVDVLMKTIAEVI